ncbi:MRN complex-interacting protein isoform X2 [Callorhinchus milii]|uniref:MRN complex-interacting protein isoform X2 n=1 Tax=Callorhinchus milii TaxID=7868 RepID=UPI001C3FE7C5|nr:MRN complex-interacting protein isoform X2 [Callorhinchus milii]
MGPQFQALRCFSCKTFQVQQVKKSKRWNCKVCGETQSVLKVYGQGSGADCRHHVQKLNLLQGEMVQAADTAPWSGECEVGVSVKDGTDWHCDEAKRPQESERAGGSRWSKYLEETPEQEDDDDQEEEAWIGASVRQQGQASTRNLTRGRSKRKKAGLGDGPRQKHLKAAGSEQGWGSSRAGVGHRSRGDDGRPAATGDVAQRGQTLASRWDRFLPNVGGDDSQGADHRQPAITELPKPHFTSKQGNEQDGNDLEGPGPPEAGLGLSSHNRYLPISDRVTEKCSAQLLSVTASKPKGEPNMELDWVGRAVSSKTVCDQAARHEPHQPFPMWAHSPGGGPQTFSPKPLLPATCDLSPCAPPTINSQNVVPATQFPGSFLSLFHTDEDFDDL